MLKEIYQLTITILVFILFKALSEGLWNLGWLYDNDDWQCKVFNIQLVNDMKYDKEQFIKTVLFPTDLR